MRTRAGWGPATAQLLVAVALAGILDSPTVALLPGPSQILPSPTRFAAGWHASAGSQVRGWGHAGGSTSRHHTPLQEHGALDGRRHVWRLGGGLVQKGARFAGLVRLRGGGLFKKMKRGQPLSVAEKGWMQMVTKEGIGSVFKDKSKKTRRELAYARTKEERRAGLKVSKSDTRVAARIAFKAKIEIARKMANVTDALMLESCSYFRPARSGGGRVEAGAPALTARPEDRALGPPPSSLFLGASGSLREGGADSPGAEQNALSLHADQKSIGEVWEGDAERMVDENAGGVLAAGKGVAELEGGGAGVLARGAERAGTAEGKVGWRFDQAVDAKLAAERDFIRKHKKRSRLKPGPD